MRKQATYIIKWLKERTLNQRDQRFLSKAARQDTHHAPPLELPVQLQVHIKQTYIWLWWRHLSRAFWPFTTVLLCAIGLSATGVFQLIDPSYLERSYIALLSILALSFIWGLWALRAPNSPPTRQDAIALIDATLPQRPISSLNDHNALSQLNAPNEIWAAHHTRLTSSLLKTKPVYPPTDLARCDPYAMRLIALIFCSAALMFSHGLQLKLPQPNTPQAQTKNTPPAVAWEGWITPPLYTQKRPIYLSNTLESHLTVPPQSVVTLFTYGQNDNFSFSQDLTEQPVERQNNQSTFLVEHSGSLTIKADQNTTWHINVDADAPPQIQLTGPIERRATSQLKQPFHAFDDYGVIKGTAAATLDLSAVERQHGLEHAPDPVAPLELSIPLPSAKERTDFNSFLTADISQQLLSNMPAHISISVEDDLKQTGRSLQESVILPGKRFFHPLAKAIAEQRRDLMWSHLNAPRVARLLRAVSYQSELSQGDIDEYPLFEPLGPFPNTAIYLHLKAIITDIENLPQKPLLNVAQHPDEHTVLDQLWEFALYIEDGNFTTTQRRLQHAQERLNDAVKHGASDAEISELMRQLSKATKEHLRWLAQEAGPVETDMPDDEKRSGSTVTQDEIQRLMDEIEKLTKEGRLEDAQRLTEKLNELLKNLKVTPQPGGGEGEGTQGQGSQSDGGGDGGQPPKGGLLGVLKEQERLADETFKSLQNDGESTPSLPDDFDERQRNIEEQLEVERQALPWISGNHGDAGRDALEQADRNMKDAQNALKDGRPEDALESQSQAIDALRDAIRNFNQPTSDPDEPKNEDGNTHQGETKEAQARDPLGREAGARQAKRSSSDALTDGVRKEDLQALDRLLKDRAKELERPKPERDYIGRLLERF